MYQDNDKISILQFIAILMMILFDVQILSVPRDLAISVGPDGWFVLLLIIGVGTAILWCFIKMSQMFPGQGVVKILQSIVGRPLGWCLGLGLFLLWIGQTARVVRMASELVQ